MKKLLTIFVLFIFVYSSNAFGNQPKSIGKYKSWEAFTYNDSKGKVCFAQTIPLERAEKKKKLKMSLVLQVGTCIENPL